MFESTQRATLRTYRELRRQGLSDRLAFESALGVFRHRFPAIAGDDATFMVADWISEDLGQ